jgi:hypothetical protein
MDKGHVVRCSPAPPPALTGSAAVLEQSSVLSALGSAADWLASRRAGESLDIPAEMADLLPVERAMSSFCSSLCMALRVLVLLVLRAVVWARGLLGVDAGVSLRSSEICCRKSYAHPPEHGELGDKMGWALKMRVEEMNRGR